MRRNRLPALMERYGNWAVGGYAALALASFSGIVLVLIDPSLRQAVLGWPTSALLAVVLFDSFAKYLMRPLRGMSGWLRGGGCAVVFVMVTVTTAAAFGASTVEVVQVYGVLCLVGAAFAFKAGHAYTAKTPEA